MTSNVVLVTGAAGLVGNAVRLLLEERGTAVLPIDRVSSTEEGRQIAECDLMDIHRLYAVTSKHRVGGIIHCGAYSGPMVARDNPNAIVRVNIVGTANVLELARSCAVPRFVFCSSTSTYGHMPVGLISEDVLPKPTSMYGASKVAGEQLVSAYSNQHGVDGVSLRLSWVYGPRRTTDCIIRTMIEDAHGGRATRLDWGADFYRQFLHVDDAANALVMALDRSNLPRQQYNVTGQSYVTLCEVANIVHGILPQANIALDPGPDPLDDIQAEFDISAAMCDFNYRPAVDLVEGIRCYEKWLSQKSELKGCL